MRALIDGDEILYKIALSYQRKKYFVTKDGVKIFKVPNIEYGIECCLEDPSMDVDFELEVDPLEGFNDKIEFQISRILALTKSTDYLICVSGTNNFRYKLATLLPYKGNRLTDNKPVHLEKLKSLFKEGFDHECSDTNEADELLVYNRKSKTKDIICSTDKDLKTVEGMNYNISKDKLRYITAFDATYNFYFQLLIGDDTDNIPHPYFLGNAAASKILEEITKDMSEVEIFNIVKRGYIRFLEATNKDGSYKTKWYSGQNVDDILEEVGNLLWMEHTPGGESRWVLPTRR